MDLDAAIFGKELFIDAMLQEYIETAFQNWNKANAGFNNGQNAIFELYIHPALETWAAEEIENWPWTDVGYYLDTCYAAYDLSVMERAFSDTTEAPVERMLDILNDAQMAAIAIDALLG